MQTLTKVHRCPICGKRRSRFAQWCRACTKQKLDEAHKEAQAIVATGKCPRCGKGLKRNLALPGWWQCEQYGAPRFRADPEGPECSFQIFTE